MGLTDNRDPAIRAFVLGIDGNVGSALVPAMQAEGWSVIAHAEGLPLPDEGDGAIVVDAGKPGAHGWHPADWPNYFHAVERAVRLIGEAERKGYAALVLCSTPWIGVRADDPYADSKALIEDIARAHNRHGRCFVVVDRIGTQNPNARSPSRFEQSVSQGKGELGERIVASVLYALEARRISAAKAPSGAART